MKLLDSSPAIYIEEIKTFESSCNLKLPKEFISFYLSYNGGVPEKNEITDGKHVFSVHQFDDFSEIKLYKKGLDEYSVPRNLDHTKTLPFACDQGGNTYALYLGRENAKVYFYTTSDEMTIHGEWQSFSDFIDGFIK
jgi:hypothetical protein